MFCFLKQRDLSDPCCWQHILGFRSRWLRFTITFETSGSEPAPDYKTSHAWVNHGPRLRFRWAR
jgi:hypothetical protein